MKFIQVGGFVFALEHVVSIDFDETGAYLTLTQGPAKRFYDEDAEDLMRFFSAPAPAPVPELVA